MANDYSDLTDAELDVQLRDVQRTIAEDLGKLTQMKKEAEEVLSRLRMQEGAIARNEEKRVVLRRETDFRNIPEAERTAKERRVRTAVTKQIRSLNFHHNFTPAQIRPLFDEYYPREVRFRPDDRHEQWLVSTLVGKIRERLLQK